MSMSIYERPEYKVILSEPPFEIRLYESFWIVEYSNETDPDILNGFGTLFRYISSENQNRQKINMTVPVIEEVLEGRMKMAFVVPKEHWNDIPQPESKWLSLNKFESGLFGVIRYSGRSDKSKENEMKHKLEEWLNENAYSAVDNYMLAFYNPPFTPPMLRRNEILVRIKNK